MSVVRRHWPDAEQQLGSVDAKPWGPINAVYDIARAERELEWHPRFSFETFLAGVRAGVTSADDLTANER